MGRYLDLLRDRADTGNVQSPHGDKSDQSDKSPPGARVAAASSTGAWLWSILSLLSHAPSSDSRPASPVREASPATVIVPAQWFEDQAAEPPYREAWATRRGVIRRREGRLERFCVICGAWGSFGYGVFGDRPGRWYCFAHRPPTPGISARASAPPPCSTAGARR
jgi:hypothetical protein